MQNEKKALTTQPSSTSAAPGALNPWIELSLWVVAILAFLVFLKRFGRHIGRGIGNSVKFLNFLLTIPAMIAIFGGLILIGIVVFLSLLSLVSTVPARLGLTGEIYRSALTIGFYLFGAGIAASVIYVFLEKIQHFFLPAHHRQQTGPQRAESSITREHLRGRALIAFERVVELAKDFFGPLWGFVFLPEANATQHFLVIGSTGSGKTMLLRLLMQSIIPRILDGTDRRAIVYDAKADIVPILKGMGGSCDIKLLNPFDKRSHAWAMGADVTSPATAQQIASILIAPSKNESQPFFTDAARALLTGVMVAFMRKAPGKWVLADVLHGCRTTSALKEVLSATEETAHLVEQYLREDLTSNNILSSLATKLQPFEFIAAAWDKADKTISLTEWVKTESVLVLGNDEAVRSALDAINRVIFRRVSELILAQSESSTRRTWVFLDELRQAGELEGLNNLLTAGRSKGACVVLGTQDIEGLKEVYGENKANEILGLCGHKAILRLDSSVTAKWASELFGQVEELETRRTYSSGESSGTSKGTSETKGKSSGRHSDSSSTSKGTSEGTTTGTNTGIQVAQQHITREVVLPSEFLSIPFPSREFGMVGFFLSPEFDGAGYRAHVSGEFLSSTLLSPSADEAVIPRDTEDQFLKPWTATRKSILGFRASIPKNDEKSDDLLGSLLGDDDDKK